MMNSRPHATASLDFSLWFALLSPLLGALLGMVTFFLFYQ